MEFLNPHDRRAIGIALIVLGLFLWFGLTLDMTAIRRNNANPNAELGIAANTNLGPIIFTQTATMVNLVMITILSIKFHYFVKQYHIQR